MMYCQKNQNQRWNKMESSVAAHFVQEILTDVGRRWKINGVLTEPTASDVEQLVRNMLKDILDTNYDSIESGGILLKRDQGKIDLYVHLGEISEDISL